MNWKMDLRAAVCASQSNLLSQPCKHRLVCSSKLLKVITNEYIFKNTAIFVSILFPSLFIFRLSGSHKAKGCYFD